MWQDSGAALQLTQFSTVSGYVTKGIVTGGSFVVLFYIALVWVTTFVALFGCECYCQQGLRVYQAVIDDLRP